MTTTSDRPLLGIGLMLLFCLFAPFADALAKLIGDAVPLLQVVAVRFAAQVAMLVPVALIAGAPIWPGRDLLGLLILRTALQIAGIALIFLALRYLPLADAIAIAYVMPFFLLLLGHLTLGEEVGWRRLAACAVGFCGTLLVMQPSFAKVGWVVLMPLAVALIFAVYMLLTRAVSQRQSPLTLQATNGIMGCAVLLPLVALAQGSGIAEADPIWPERRYLWLLLWVGVFGTLSHLVLTGALRYAPASTLGPMQYLEIPFAVLLGWLMFDAFPNGLALVGIVVVMAAGLYIIWREQRLSRNAPESPVPTPGAAE